MHHFHSNVPIYIQPTMANRCGSSRSLGVMVKGHIHVITASEMPASFSSLQQLSVSHDVCTVIFNAIRKINDAANEEVSMRLRLLRLLLLWLPSIIFYSYVSQIVMIEKVDSDEISSFQAAAIKCQWLILSTSNCYNNMTVLGIKASRKQLGNA